MTLAARTADKPRPIPGRIGGVLRVLHVLVAHARYFAATVTARVELPQFATAAAVFGTYDMPVILARIERGIQRALALQRYLLARAARGRNLRFAWPPRVELQPRHLPPPGPERAPRSAERRPSPARPRPEEGHVQTAEELDAWVRRRPVGRTMADICMDLGLVPGFCDGTFWNKVEKVFRRYGGSINRFYEVRAKREESFQRERDRRPETWDTDWRDLSKPTVRAALGCLFGETPPETGGLLTGLPAIVPS